MVTTQPLDLLPIWSYLHSDGVLTLFLAAEAGFRLGKPVQQRWPDKSEAGVGIMVGAALALLGFLLAFVTSIALGNFQPKTTVSGVRSQRHRHRLPACRLSG